MSKILVVEPWKMLQQAMAQILIPEHQIRLSAALPLGEDSSLKEYDVVIVDAAALREKNILGSHEVSILLNSGIPTIWIEENDVEIAPKEGKVLVVKRPIERKAIFLAVGKCLELVQAAESGENFAQRNADKVAAKSQPEEQKSESVVEGAHLIDLVDVIEEGSTQKNKLQTREKKQ